MKTFIKAKLKKSDDPTNINKYRLAVNITEYNIILKLIFQRIIISKFLKCMILIRANSSGKTSDVEYDASNDGGSNQSFDGLDPQPRYVGKLV